MANSNFVVQNGLTVGPLTIDAATGSISTPGNVNITGNLGVSSISKNDSSINIIDTGASSVIVMNIDGTTEHTLTAARASFLSEVLAAGNIVANSATTSTSTTTGALVVVGGIGASGNLNIGGQATLVTQGTTPTSVTNKQYVDSQNAAYGVVFGF
jgi:hypothetical protein